MRTLSLTSSLLMLSSVLLSAVAGCQSYTVIPDEGRARLDEAHQGELLYVKQSLYAGRFYDDDRYRLLHARRFEELTYLLDAEGQPIPPPPANEIVPAGTRVRVERIEWPDGDAVFRRPIYTPRYTTWIFLRVASAPGEDVTFERSERHIMLLPGGISDEATFNEWFDSALTRTNPNPWLRSLPDVQRVAIARKEPTVGMTYEALTSAMGFPDRITHGVDSVEHGDIEVAQYGALRVQLKDGLVIGTSSSSSSSSSPSTSPSSPASSSVSTESAAPSLAPVVVDVPAADPAAVEPAPSAPSAGD